jgi:hypothetical protein
MKSKVELGKLSKIHPHKYLGVFHGQSRVNRYFTMPGLRT